MNKNKIFTHNLNNNSKSIEFKPKQNAIGYDKYLPSFSKEWKNTIYSFNKEILANIPTLTQNVNKIIKSYFDLFFKDGQFIDIRQNITLEKRRNFLRRIYSSNAEIKHTNDKIIITLYIFNKEKEFLKNKYLNMNYIVNAKLIKKFSLLYRYNIRRLHTIILYFKKKYTYRPNIMYKKTYIKSKIENLNRLKNLKHIYLTKIWSKLISHYLDLHLRRVRKYSLLFSLNINKFNKVKMLGVLSTILNKIQNLNNKKIEYNIVSLKSFSNHPDLFTNFVTLRLKRKKIHRLREMYTVLNKTCLPLVNTIQERTFVKKKMDKFRNRVRNLKIISNMKKGNLIRLLQSTYRKNTQNISNNIYNSIKYKNIAGVRIEVKGRLTKRYRADRSVYAFRWKGGLKNIDSSYQRKSTRFFRGNVKSNIAYSISASKRRIGAFAVKGWIAGK